MFSKESIPKSVPHCLISIEQMYDSFPAVMKLLPGPHNKIFELFKVLSGFINEEVERHKKDIDFNNPRDYVDAFLIEIEKVREELLDASIHCIHIA